MCEKITRWLETVGLGQYASAFAKQDITWDILSELDHDALEHLGVGSLGHRLKLLKSINLMQSAEVFDSGTKSPSAPEGDRADSSFVAWERHPEERKPVTLLFADIANSTAITEKLDAEEARDLLYGATQHMFAAVESNRGTVCRFVGDGVMAMFGAPVASERHAVEACSAALEMRQTIRDYTQKTLAPLGIDLAIRVGLHSGEVVVLTIGEGSKLEYDASGPTVALAARMERLAKSGDILLSAATHALAARNIDTHALEPATVKGFSEPVDVFSLQRLVSLDNLTTNATWNAFVGRHSELNQFKNILDTCLEERYGQTIHLRGEPGIGKTRLTGEFRRIAETMGVKCHRGLVLEFGVGKGQDAVRALVRSLLGLVPGAGKEERANAADRVVEDGLLKGTERVHLNDLLDLPQSMELMTLYAAMDPVTPPTGAYP